MEKTMPRTTPRDPNAIQAKGVYTVQCFDKDGNLKWEEEAVNALMDEGEQLLLDLALRGSALASWYLGLLTSAQASLPAETSTLASVSANEPTSGTSAGYARQAISRDNTGWPTLALNGGDYQATSKSVTFTASGDWASPIRWLILTTVASGTAGKLVSVAQLSADRTLLTNDSLNITYSLKLQ